MARRYSDQGRLGTSFFFSRGGEDVGHAGKFVTTIALQLANSIPMLQRIISEVIRERSDIASHSLSDQWRQLVLRPLSKLTGDSYPSSSYVLVVDALDECLDYSATLDRSSVIRDSPAPTISYEQTRNPESGTASITYQSISTRTLCSTMYQRRL